MTTPQPDAPPRRRPNIRRLLGRTRIVHARLEKLHADWLARADAEPQSPRGDALRERAGHIAEAMALLERATSDGLVASRASRPKPAKAEKAATAEEEAA